MKSLCLCLLFLSASIMNAARAQKSFSFEPAKPVAGQKITIHYNPSSTILAGVTGFTAYAYLLEGKLPVVQPIVLMQKGQDYTAQINTNDTTKAVFVTFSKEEKRDNNNDEGYYTFIYTANGDPVMGAQLAIAQGFGSFGGIWGMTRNADLSSAWSKKEFNQYPASKEKYRTEYISMLSQSKEPADKDELKLQVDQLAAKTGITEAELAQAKFYYERLLKDKDKAASTDKLMKEQFPNGNWIKTERVTAFQTEKDLAKKEELYAALLHDFPAKSEQDNNTFSSLAAGLATQYANKGDYEKMKLYASQVKNKSMLANLYNTVAWKLAGEGLTGTPGDVTLGKEFSWQSLQIAQDNIKAAKDKPSYFTDVQWKEQLEGSYYGYADTYALLLYRLQDYKNAYQYEKDAVEHAKRKAVDMNEAFCVYSEKVKGAAATQPELEAFIKDGRYNPGMKEQLKRIYLAQGKTDEQWNTYVTTLEKAHKEIQRAEVAKTMIHENAPSFALKDIGGNDVSLASLKGKIVIVDFWATWCGPCKASFPAMKLAIEKYKDDPDVKFVFIDTWETGEKDKVKTEVVSFIDKNAYPFHVLMDYDNAVVEKYKVEGIPTKFVLDKDNQVRFKSIGYGGNTGDLVDELTLMIEMAKNGDAGSGKESKKAF